MITLEQALTRATSQLAAHPDLRATALPDAALLLTHLLGISRATLIAHPEHTMTREQQSAYQGLLERRLRFEPMQYILGEQEFFGLRLHVSPAVLIPRPETEMLVEAVLARVPQHASLRIVDVGTGSGAIAIALAHTLPAAFVTAIDLSPEALAVAQENASIHQVASRIDFRCSDLLGAVLHDEPFDIIISNPPYVATTDSHELHPQVRDYEPAQALFAGPKGTDIYERLIPQAFSLLRSGGLLALEIGHGQQEPIARLLSVWQDVDFVLDLQRISRVAIARKP